MSKNRIFIEFISSLTETQIHILRHVIENEEELDEIASFPKFYEHFISSFKEHDLSQYEFKYAVNDLENKGLLTLEDGLDDFSSNASLLADSSHKEASVKVTDFGNEFIEYLKK